MASIFKPKKSKFWWIQYWHEGKRYRYSLKTADRKFASHLKREKEDSLAKGRSPLPLLNVSASQCLEEYIRATGGRKSKKHLYNSRRDIERFIEFSQITKLSQISYSSLEKHLTYRQETDKLGVWALNRAIISLKAWLNWAVKRKYLFENPLKGFPKYKLLKNPPRYLSYEEVVRLLEASRETPLYPMIATAVYTGIRLGELFNLEWQDFDFEKKMLTIVNKANFQTKSKRFRVIPLTQEFIEILKPYRRNSGICFSSNGNGHKFISTPWREFNKILLKADLNGPKKVGWHTLRHTYASLLIMAGVDLPSLSELLGHADISTTMIYSHLSKKHLYEAVNKLPSFNPGPA